MPFLQPTPSPYRMRLRDWLVVVAIMLAVPAACAIPIGLAVLTR